jgi:tol-pal system-associated acyl-CoA thioesterase
MIDGKIEFNKGLCAVNFRIYYEDTDAGGVVYYGNYFRYFEWGRTEYLRCLELPFAKYIEQKILFVVAGATINYSSPGQYNDLLTLHTYVMEIGRCSITFQHKIIRKQDSKDICSGTVKLVSVNNLGKPIPVPVEIKDKVSKLLGSIKKNTG